jgi:predicted acylesterase/phospholipase RssA
MIRFPLYFMLAAFAFGSLGCIAQIHYVVPPLEADPSEACSHCELGGAFQDVVGIAVSGGGSRAAVYGAAGLEALWEHGMIEHVTHLSSVSGGSIASSYFATNRPACEQASSEAEREMCWRTFFSEFRTAMRHNFFRSMELRQLSPLRMFSNTRRATSLADTLDKVFLHDKTFRDLRVGDGDGITSPGDPILLVNASSYDGARRFVFSNLCIPAVAEKSATSTSSGSSPLARSELRAQTFSRPDCPRSVPSDFPISLAVASSASFPGIGPVSIEVPSTCEGGSPEWWHLGDGGIFDNSGVDTLEEVVLWQRHDDRKKLKRALILSLDSGKRVDPGKNTRIKNMWLYLQHPGLMFDIASRRGQAYHDLVWERLRNDFASEGISFENFQIRYANAELDEWPASCASREATGVAIEDELESIPTALNISDCHADLLELAAHQMVHETLNGEVVRRMKRAGFAIREVPADH